ncbi:hypothetical protein P153DRAFT_135887 [Dothidotthia symphoricarpi CBS 119687]|uniref:Uncharacterized protein n=1 Tax=Dothidotthia symphoricarpi CBS 119687 TaxID=1392245 RepID=A0A6A5ZYQ0_9PLEO|nr:uncharacterized protein P153DRAFT_135887 [Dothidotthia symphoricarpi CBS 119687]KAF2124145.1 hypothetical protein P153DRAFT_135887 [Dothidotthia symphoricarpi CBS 119687]
MRNATQVFLPNAVPMTSSATLSSPNIRVLPAAPCICIPLQHDIVAPDLRVPASVCGHLNCMRFRGYRKWVRCPTIRLSRTATVLVPTSFSCVTCSSLHTDSNLLTSFTVHRPCCFYFEPLRTRDFTTRQKHHHPINDQTIATQRPTTRRIFIEYITRLVVC